MNEEIENKKSFFEKNQYKIMGGFIVFLLLIIGGLYIVQENKSSVLVSKVDKKNDFGLMATEFINKPNAKTTIKNIVEHGDNSFVLLTIDNDSCVMSLTKYKQNDVKVINVHCNNAMQNVKQISSKKDLDPLSKPKQ